MLRTVSVLAGVALASLAMAAPPAASPAPPYAALLGETYAPSPLVRELRALTDGIGGRVSGSPAMARAVDWGLAGFREAGVDARAEPYVQPLSWAEGATRLDVAGHSDWHVALVSNGWSPPTPAGGVEAALVPVGSGTAAEFARAGAAVRDGILLVDSRVIETWADLSEEYDRTGPIIERALTGGARAILWTGARSGRLLYRHTDAVKGELAPLPMAIVARLDAKRLARLAEAGPVRVRLDMPNVIGGPVQVANVVGEIRGRERPDEVVVLGAHLDSWDLGTGALDNGCNAALVVAAARAIRASGLVPRRTIRFVLFSGEEQGMLGSRAYAATHRAELDRTVAMLAIDAGAGRVTGFHLSGRDDVARALPAILAPLDAYALDPLALEGDLGTDNVDFMLEGVPTLVADQAPSNYMANYHAASDTLDQVDLQELQRNLAIMTLATFAIADSPHAPGPRLDRAGVERVLKSVGLDEEMKRQGLWAEFAAGQRGRAP